ncbi:cystathionine beta-synthase (beta-thionase) [Moniliophthora roreri]|nr:cystathionine beta-synthase (beta-thionase) [Moniliophthora roreri]
MANLLISVPGWLYLEARILFRPTVFLSSIPNTHTVTTAKRVDVAAAASSSSEHQYSSSSASPLLSVNTSSVDNEALYQGYTSSAGTVPRILQLPRWDHDTINYHHLPFQYEVTLLNYLLPLPSFNKNRVIEVAYEYNLSYILLKTHGEIQTFEQTPIYSYHTLTPLTELEVSLRNVFALDASLSHFISDQSRKGTHGAGRRTHIRTRSHNIPGSQSFREKERTIDAASFLDIP